MKKYLLALLILSMITLSCRRQPVSVVNDDDATGRVVVKLDGTVVFDKSFGDDFYWFKSQDVISFHYIENGDTILAGAISHLPPLHTTYPLVDTTGTTVPTNIILKGNPDKLFTPDQKPFYRMQAAQGTISHPGEKTFHAEGQCLVWHSEDIPDYTLYDFELDVDVAKVVE